MTLEPDTILNSRYRVLEILGEGGMGAVYKAQDVNLGVTVAVKENLFTTEEYTRQFRVEATLLATLRHPNLTRVTDHFVQDEIQYIVMDYIDGEDLRQRMERVGILDEDEVVKIGVSLCDALSYLHSLSPRILHRDVKPGNVRISPSGHVFLVDFGLAKIVQGNEMTITGARAMTPGYSPPEQYGTARTDNRSDIYSLGATLYSALTGKLPEDGLARAMKQAQLTPIRTHNPRVTRKLASIVEESLAVQSENRFQTADEFRQALVNSRKITRRRLTSQELVIEPPPPSVPLAKRSAKPSRPGGADSRRDSGRRGVQEVPPAEPIHFQNDAEQLENGRKKRARKSRARLTWFVALILIGAGIGSFYYFPEFSNQALALIYTATGTPTATATETSPTPTTTPAPPTPTLAVILNETALPSPSPTATNTQPPTATLAPSATPTATLSPTPAPTPTGGSAQLAFVSDRSGSPQIWLMDVDGSNLIQVTDLSGGACQPSWSPDGERLIFISPCLTEFDEYSGSALFTIDADGDNLTPVIGSRNGDYDPDWSPDGSQILFTSSRNSQPQIFLLSLDDNSITMLADTGLKNLHPEWNVDGTKIAFISTRDGPFQVWTMNPDGSEQARFSRSGELRDSTPVWSPDGRFLVFTQRNQTGGTPTIILAPIEDDGFSEIRLTPRNSPARSGAYSPDGKWLVYEGWPDGDNHDIYLLDLTNLTNIRLTSEASFEFDPAWRPLP